MKTYSLGAAGKSSKGGEKATELYWFHVGKEKLQDNVSLFLGTLGGKIRAKITDLVHQSKEKMTGAETALSIVSLPHLNMSLTIVHCINTAKKFKYTRLVVVFLICFPIQVPKYKLIFFSTLQLWTRFRLQIKKKKGILKFKNTLCHFIYNSTKRLL